MTKQLIHIIALGTLLATAGLSAQAQPLKPHPGHCPEGTVPAAPPLNPQLGCLPDSFTAEPPFQPNQSTFKPEKQVSVFQPVLIKQQPQQQPPPGCPPGWTQASKPLNPQLGCLPGNIQSQSSSQPAQSTLKPEKQVSVFQPALIKPQPSFGCPPGWTQASKPLNSQLGCLPGNIKAQP